MRRSSSMRANRRWPAFAVAFAVLAGLVGYHLIAPEKSAPAASTVSEPAPVMIEKASAAPDTPVMAETRVEAPVFLEESVDPSDSNLQEAELEHLSEVFQNSLYSLFQYEFPMNREGRAAIDAFVASMPENLGSDDLDAVSVMIAEQLRTPEAEDLAFIITHLYRLEQAEARLIADGEPITTMEQQLEAQQRLSQLREQWFGPELSEFLFADDDEEFQANPDAETTEAPSDEQAGLADVERAWDQRYQAFVKDKQFIDRAGLDQAEKDRQVETLLQQHYAPEELEAARAYDQRQN